MMKFFLIGSLSIFLLSACDSFFSRTNQGELSRFLDARTIKDMNFCYSHSTDIHINKISNLNTDDYIDVIDYIPLETNESILVGNIDKLLIYEDRIYILDIYKAKSVFIFDIKGLFIKKISLYGNNSTEYKFLRDMELDIPNRQIVLYDRNGGKLLLFDLNGNFIRTQRLGFRFSNFKILSNGNYLFYTDNNPNDFNSEISGYSLLIGHPKGVIFYRGFPNNFFLESLNYSANFNLSNVGFNNSYEYICPRLSNAIFQIDTIGKLKKLYQIHLPSGCMEEYLQNINPNHFIKEMASKGYFYSFGDNVLINDSLFYFNFSGPDKIMNELWYNRISGQYYCINKKLSSTGKIISVPNPLSFKDNQLIGAIDASLITHSKSSFSNAHRKIIHDGRLSEEILGKIDKVNQDDNPVLMVYRIKWQ